MLKEILILFLITLIPFVELRGSIPYGISILGLNWSTVFLIAVISNTIIGPLIYFLFDKFTHNFLLKNKWFSNIYARIIKRTQRKIKKYIDRYGEIGVAIFIAIPIPGTGSYSAALGSYLIGLNYKKFIIANFIGVLLAGIIVTLTTVGIKSLL
jgi:uncharacterized membrane protein